MQKTSLKSTTPNPDVRTRLEQLPSDVVSIATRLQCLKQLLDEAERDVATAFIAASGGEDRVVGNVRVQVFSFCQQDSISQATNYRRILQILEQDQRVLDAEATMAPLLAELAALEVTEIAEACAKAERQHAAREALEAAQLAAANSPEVIAARKALEAA